LKDKSSLSVAQMATNVLTRGSFDSLAIYMAYAMGPVYKRCCRALYGWITIEGMYKHVYKHNYGVEGWKAAPTTKAAIWQVMRWFPRGWGEDKPAVVKVYSITTLQHAVDSITSLGKLNNVESNLDLVHELWSKLFPRRNDILWRREINIGLAIFKPQETQTFQHTSYVQKTLYYNIVLGKADMPAHLRHCTTTVLGPPCYDMLYFGEICQWNKPGFQTIVHIAHEVDLVYRVSFPMSVRQQNNTLLCQGISTINFHPTFYLRSFGWDSSVWQQIVLPQSPRWGKKLSDADDKADGFDSHAPSGRSRLSS